MAISDNFSTAIAVSFSVFYVTIFILSTIGNTMVLITCYKTLKRRHSSFLWLLVNLASADLLFTSLSVLNVIGYFWRWVGGNGTCKLQGFFVEVSYTTSIMTLVTISYQRLQATTDPFNARARSWFNREYLKLVVIWGLSLLVCTPLLYIYHVKTNKDDIIVCATSRHGNIAPQIFYSLHATLFFVVPLFYMIFTQMQIYITLRSSVAPGSELFSSRSNQRNRKASRTLAALTIAFVICWSPFMVTRTLIYFKLASGSLAWRASQLLILLNAGLDPLLYGLYDGDMKALLRRVLFKNRNNLTLPSVSKF